MDFEDIFTDHVTRSILSVLVFIALSWNGEKDWGGGGGRPYIKYKLCPFAIYSCVMENGGTRVIFHFSPISH